MGVYPEQTSVYPGDTLRLHLSFSPSVFRLDFYRHGAEFAFQFSVSGPSPGLAAVPPPPTDTTNPLTYADWNLPAGDVQIPAHPPPGGGFANLVVPSQAPSPVLFQNDDQALFVVKNPNPGSRTSILYKLPLLTYHAYNDSGGINLYTDEWANRNTPGRIGVTLHRPGGGTGGAVGDGSTDPNDPSSPLQTYAHWDSWFVRWLETNQYLIDYCTDLDVHADQGALLRSYNLLLSVGHDEYWTAEMRDNVEGFIGAGGNVAFFSGNTSYRRITFDDPFTIRRPGYWTDFNRPENSLTGVSFRNGWYRLTGPRPGYTVQNSQHWVFAETRLAEGDVLGEQQQLVGYESDGAAFDRHGHRPFVPDHSDGTPSSFVILGVSDIANAGGGIGNGVATMGVYQRNGTVFTGATTDWPRVVGKLLEPRVGQITHNVVRRLSTLDQISGRLLFYRDYAQNGTGDVDTPKVIGRGGWADFKFLFSGGDGIIYAVPPDGRLLFYRDYTRDGTGDVDTPSTIGQGGWADFIFLLAGRPSFTTAVHPAGRLLFYRDYTRDGTGDVDTPSTIGQGGWADF